MSATHCEVPAPMTDEAFTAFYRAELDGQVRRAALLCGSRELANDIVHDAMVEIYRRRDQLDAPGPYLNRAVVNKCWDAHRRQRRRRDLLVRLRPDDATPDHDVVADALGGLPFPQRAAVVLRFYVGMTNSEIAAALHCPPGSIGPWLDRAFKQLRKVL